MEKIVFNSISDFHSFFGLDKPENHLFSILPIKSGATCESASGENKIEITNNLYSLSFKRIFSGEILYGREKYDYSDGTLIFTRPGTNIVLENIKVECDGYVIVFDTDFLLNTSLKSKIGKYGFFEYSIKESLHLPKDHTAIIFNIFENINREYSSFKDDHSTDIILSQISSLLEYSDRFYHNQFLQRKNNADNSVQSLFLLALEKYYANSVDSIPTLSEIAKYLNMTNRYLNDSLKAETGYTAISNLQSFCN